MKKKIIAVLAAILAMQTVVMPVSAVHIGSTTNVPTEDASFVEMSLADFLEENPDYVGDEEPISLLTEIETESGSYTWTKVGSYWYLYDPAGNQVIGDWFQDYSDNWYYINSSGRMVTGWYQVGSYWYYFNAGGIMQTDWYQVGGKWYYLRTEAVNDSYPVGSAVTGAQYLPETVGSTTRSRNYYFADNTDCSMQEFAYPLDETRAQNVYVNRGIRTTDGHNGLDINSYWNEEITSVGDGSVLYAGSYLPQGNGTGTGGTVIMSTNMSDGTTIYVRYFHMNSVSATKTSISEGDTIGYVGNTGEVYSQQTGEQAGKHLHIDMSLFARFTSNGPTTLTAADALNPAAFFPNISFTGNNPFGSNKN